MTNIEEYKFGKIIINGAYYTSDIIILPGGEIFSWWRETGHHVINKDIEKIYMTNPSILILGTGDSGLMKIDPEVVEYCNHHSIKLITEKTDRAVKIYNETSSEQKAAGFHLTC